MHLCFSIEKIIGVSCSNRFNSKFEYIKKLVLSVLIKIETSNIKNKTSQMCNFGDIIGMTNVENFQYLLSKKIKRGNIKCRDQKSLSLSSYLNWGYNTILGPNILWKLNLNSNLTVEQHGFNPMSYVSARPWYRPIHNVCCARFSDWWNDRWIQSGRLCELQFDNVTII